MSDQNSAMEVPKPPITPANPEPVTARINNLETALSTLVTRVSSIESNVTATLETHLPAIRNDLATMSATIVAVLQSPKVASIVTEVTGVIHDRIAAIESFLQGLTLPNHAAFTPAPKPAEKPTA